MDFGIYTPMRVFDRKQLRNILSKKAFWCLLLCGLVLGPRPGHCRASDFGNSFREDPSVLQQLEGWFDSQDDKVKHLQRTFFSEDKASLAWPPISSICNGQKLSAEQQKIARCLDIVTEESQDFVRVLEKARRSREKKLLCAKWVADAAKESKWTNGKPSGCTGPAKAKNILATQRQFVDLVPLMRGMFHKEVKGLSARSAEAIAQSLMAPPGTIMSFTGNNRGKCGPLGHFTAKVRGQEFCHFFCERCPGLPKRFVDKILIKIRPEYLELFQGPRDIQAVCNQVLSARNNMNGPSTPFRGSTR